MGKREGLPGRFLNQSEGTQRIWVRRSLAVNLLC